MSRYLDPKADVVFKKVFGEHPHLLISFLNAVLPLPDDSQIIELEYLASENAPKIPIFKRTIADVRCRDQKGRVFIVEMQIEWAESFKQRLLLETSQALVKQLKVGDDYRLLQPVYGLGLIAHPFDSSPQWYHHYQLTHVDKIPRDIIEHLQLVLIELSKFPMQSSSEKKLRLLWLRFMQEINHHTRTPPTELCAVPEINEALRLVEESAYNEAELNAYDWYLDAVRTEKTLMNDRYRKGEDKARHAIAKNMLVKGCEIALIAECTGLTETQVQELS